MSYFFEHGRFPEDIYEYPRKSKNLFVVLCWNIILCLPLVWYFISVILSGSIASLLTAASIVLVGKLHNQCGISYIFNTTSLNGMEINFSVRRSSCEQIDFFPMKGSLLNRSFKTANKQNNNNNNNNNNINIFNQGKS